MSRSLAASVTHPHVYVRTLGLFHVQIQFMATTWYGGGLGARQLQSGAMYLFARPDTWVALRELIPSRAAARPNYVVTGVAQLFTRWGLKDAIERDDERLMLRKHPLWQSDTLELEAALQHVRRVPTLADRLAILEPAVALCQGAFMHAFDANPLFSLSDQQVQWDITQCLLINDFCRACLATADVYRYRQALFYAQHAMQLELEDKETYLLAAAAAKRLRMAQTAVWYTQRAAAFDD